MLSQFGFYSLIFGLICSIFLVYKSFYFYKINCQKVSTYFYSVLFLQLFFVILSFIFLVASFVVSDFSNETVFNNSHTSKPLFYKISGAWGNHEGSLLLWLFVLTLFIFLYLPNSKKLKINYRYLSIFFHELIIIGFFLFIILTSNPFKLLFPIPLEGLGLNPILQDPALAIHPPILYFGYVGTSLIFSTSLAATVTSNLNSKWANHIKKWILISWIFLTLGIMLGSIWAYYELGWGGFWFWDPVENVSLMPWFCLTALLHTVLVLEKRNYLKNWTVILSITTFSLSMSGTFLVRSGILNSIHTFANDPSRGIFILAFLFMLVVMAVTIFFIYSSSQTNDDSDNYYWFSKETAVLINNWFMMYFLSVVLVGTIYPIFLEVLTNQKISVGPPFYQKLIVPFLIPFLVFMTLGPRIKWIKDKFDKVKFTQVFIFIILIIFSIFIVEYSEVNFLFASILIATSIYLFINAIGDFFTKNIQLPQKISHLALSVFILGVILNGILSKEINSNMKVGDKIILDNKTISFISIKFETENNYNLLKGNFEIQEAGKKILRLEPEIRVYNQPIISTSEADIKTNLLYDNFIVFNLLKDEKIFNVRYQYKPLMLWIWISLIMMSIGGLLATIKK